MSRFSGVCFDLDGLLVDTEGMHVDAYLVVGRHLGIALTEEYINSFIGEPTRENVKRVMRDYQIPLSRFDELLDLRYRSYLEAVQNTRFTLMPGALECLQLVKKKDLIATLVTSSMKEHALAVLNTLPERLPDGSTVHGSFDHEVFGDEVEQCKPAPDLYIEAVRRMSIEPEETLALEDSGAGVIAAKRAGLTVIAVPCPNTHKQDISSADYLVSGLNQVCGLGIL